MDNDWYGYFSSLVYGPNESQPLKNTTIEVFLKQYRSLYASQVLPKLSVGRQKLRGMWGEDLGWYDPEEDRELMKIDAMYDLFECLKAHYKK